jgi:hypothetical protein
MKRLSINEVLEAAGITKAEYSTDYSTLGVSLTDIGILKLARYKGELTPDLKKHLDYKLPFVQARAESRKQREVEKKQHEAEKKQHEAEKKAQASADLDQQLTAKLKGAHSGITDAEIKDMLPELRRRHFLAEIERQEEAKTLSRNGL